MITRAQSKLTCWNQAPRLPYGLEVEEVRLAVESIYDFLHAINGALEQHDLTPVDVEIGAGERREGVEKRNGRAEADDVTAGHRLEATGRLPGMTM